MATCEMCGGSGDLKKTRVEGTVLKLCEDCQDLGEVVDQPSAKKKKQRPHLTRPPKPKRGGSERELVQDAGRRVKRAREDRELTVSELAKQLKEKASVVRRVEAGRLKPDRSLARKFEKQLGVTLYEQPPEASGGTREQSEQERTLGDVADVHQDD